MRLSPASDEKALVIVRNGDAGVIGETLFLFNGVMCVVFRGDGIICKGDTGAVFDLMIFLRGDAGVVIVVRGDRCRSSCRAVLCRCFPHKSNYCFLEILLSTTVELSSSLRQV